MSAMVDRVADALFEAAKPFGEPMDETDALWCAMARAAIEAMREPVLPMGDAGARVFGANAYMHVDVDEAAAIYIAMIDEALK